MEPPVGEPGAPQGRLVVAVEVARRDRGADRAREDQPAILPGVADALTLEPLPLLVRAQPAQQFLRQPQVAPTRLRLQEFLQARQFARDVLQLPPHAQRGVRPVDVLPQESEEFAAAQAKRQGDGVQRR